MNPTVPTQGFMPVEIEYKEHRMELLDMPGNGSALWRMYYKDTDAVVFVIDTKDERRMDDVAHILFHDVFEDKKLKDAVLLVYANKVDEPPTTGKSPGEQLQKRLGLETNPLSKDRIWHVEDCSALTGYGINKGFSWLCDQLAHPAKKKKSKKDTSK